MRDEHLDHIPHEQVCRMVIGSAISMGLELTADSVNTTSTEVKIADDKKANSGAVSEKKINVQDKKIAEPVKAKKVPEKTPAAGAGFYLNNITLVLSPFSMRSL